MCCGAVRGATAAATDAPPAATTGRAPAAASTVFAVPGLVNPCALSPLPLALAAGTGKNEVASLLISKGADVNATKDISGFTPLHYAACEGNKEVASLLISKGADVNARVQYELYKGYTPLKLAIMNRYKAVADLLRKHGGKE